MFKPHHKLLFSVTFLIICLCSLFGYYYWQKKLPLISPLSLIEKNYFKQQQKNKVVYGFIPYWNLRQNANLQINHLTHLAYFAVDLNNDGSIHKRTKPNELEPGWNKLNSNETKALLYQSRLLQQKTVLTITAMDPDLIQSILNKPENADNAINSILQVYKDFQFDGLNIDFEYVGLPSDQTIDNFTEFIKKLKTQCQAMSLKCFIDIDVFGDSSEKKRLWDLEKLETHVEHIIVMAYDYYRKSSTKAGPVAPLTGSCNQTQSSTCLDQDILTHLTLYIKKIPSEKIILGVPFYGYEWETASEEFMANTYPKSGSLATYQRIQSLITEPTTSSLSAKWSNQTLSPYLTYYKDNKIKQIHFENVQSLSLKMDVIKAANLGGVAIWALGYETPFEDIWTPISNLNKN